jgi:hypothetical protein
MIALHDGLRRTGRLHAPEFAELAVGELVKLDSGPAVGPLRRWSIKVRWLLGLIAPMLGIEVQLRQAQNPL